jgi:tetratricopeptide (TPR) repeat protein
VGFRFFRRVKIAPGLTLNLSKRGASVSAGPRGAKFTVGTSGARATAGIPGTGLFYTQKVGGGSRAKRKSPQPPPLPERGAEEAEPAARAAGSLDLGFFQRLVTSAEEEAFVDGTRAMLEDQPEAALAKLRQAASLADGAFMSGYMALKLERFEEGAALLEDASRRPGELGRVLDKYGLQAQVQMPVTEMFMAVVGVDERGARLGIVEALQRLERWDEAIKHLRLLHEAHPHDALVKLSYVELVFEARPENQEVCKRIAEMTADVDNESVVHAALLYYKARAMRALGLNVAARDALTDALRRKMGRPEELILALRYERAQVYESLGRKSQARKEYERIYSADPGYEDAAQRLGL